MWKVFFSHTFLFISPIDINPLNSLIGKLLLGYLDESKARSKADDDNAVAATFTAPPVIAKPKAPAGSAGVSNSINDGFAMPAARPPKGAAVPSLLGGSNDDAVMGEEEEEVLNPWESK